MLLPHHRHTPQTHTHTHRHTPQTHIHTHTHTDTTNTHTHTNTHTQTSTHRHTQDNYCNPRHACALRINKVHNRAALRKGTCTIRYTQPKEYA